MSPQFPNGFNHLSLGVQPVLCLLLLFPYSFQKGQSVGCFFLLDLKPNRNGHTCIVVLKGSFIEKYSIKSIGLKK